MVPPSVYRPNKVPLYHQIALVLRAEFASGQYEVGAQIPPEHDLMQRFGVSRATIRQAVDRLVEEGLLMREQGRGTFLVSPPVRETVTELAGTLGAIDSLARDTTVRLISAAYSAPPSRIARDLDVIPSNQPVLRVTRVRLTADEPFEFLTNWIAPPWATTINLDELKKLSLVQLLRSLGVLLDWADQLISATLASPDVSEHLNVAVGSPLLQSYRIYYAQGKPVMVLESLYRPDRYAYRVRLSATEPVLSDLWITPTGVQEGGEDTGR